MSTVKLKDFLNAIVSTRYTQFSSLVDATTGYTEHDKHVVKRSLVYYAQLHYEQFRKVLMNSPSRKVAHHHMEPQ